MFDGTPGPELVAELAAAAAAEVPAPMAELVDQIAAWERVAAWVSAMQTQAVATFTSARARVDRAEGAPGDQVGRCAVDEVALARRVSTTAAAAGAAFAEGMLDDHPAVLAGMLAGDISTHAARSIVKATEVLPAHLRRAVDEVIALEARQLTPGQVRAAVERRVLEADPSAAERRARAARNAKRVALLPGAHSTATIWAGLPAEQAVACWESVDSRARSLRKAGDHRSLDHLRCDTFVERLTGCRSATPGQAGGSPIEVHVVISAATLLGLDGVPARLHGYGALPAGVARRLARGPNTFFRRLVADPVDGRLLDRGSRRYRIPKTLREGTIARDQTWRWPGSTARIREVDHVEDHAHGGETSGGNLQGLGVRAHHGKHHLGWDVVGDANEELTWVTPTGHRYPSRPPPVLGHGSHPWTPPPSTIPWTLRFLRVAHPRC